MMVQKDSTVFTEDRCLARLRLVGRHGQLFRPLGRTRQKTQKPKRVKMEGELYGRIGIVRIGRMGVGMNI